MYGCMDIWVFGYMHKSKWIYGGMDISILTYLFMDLGYFEYSERGELHRVVSHKSVCLFPYCHGHQRLVNDTRDMSGIHYSCLGCVGQVSSLLTVKLKLSTAKF